MRRKKRRRNNLSIWAIVCIELMKVHNCCRSNKICFSGWGGLSMITLHKCPLKAGAYRFHIVGVLLNIWKLPEIICRSFLIFKSSKLLLVATARIINVFILPFKQWTFLFYAQNSKLCFQYCKYNVKREAIIYIIYPMTIIVFISIN